MELDWENYSIHQELTVPNPISSKTEEKTMKHKEIFDPETEQHELKPLPHNKGPAPVHVRNKKNTCITVIHFSTTNFSPETKSDELSL